MDFYKSVLIQTVTGEARVRKRHPKDAESRREKENGDQNM